MLDIHWQLQILSFYNSFDFLAIALLDVLFLTKNYHIFPLYRAFDNLKYREII